MKHLLFLALAWLVALSPTLVAQDSDPARHPDRQVQAGVPQGKLTTGQFEQSQIYPGTRREYSVYVPAQYKPEQPASLMVFMDGAGYSKADGAFRVPIVFDNLIHQQAMPITIAVFVNPGTVPHTRDDATDRSTRSFEYDSMGDRYSKFLINEFLPVALKDLNVSSDPKQRAICGISSGGICAFTVAWQRPDQFGKVLSHIGSFTNIREGWAYPGLVRQTKNNPKALKVYLQEGQDDLNNLFGNWPLANRDLAAALQFAGYEHKLVMTEGGHSGQWAGYDLPNALRWLWAENTERPKVDSLETKPQWMPHADAVVRDDVPQGKLEEMPPFESKIFENTVRDWSIYVPAQYRADQPAALMIFQDGPKFAQRDGRWRVPVVFDNLIAKGEMPPTIAVFISPGHDQARPRRQREYSNRSLEYDSLGDRFSRLLLEEILPEVEKKYAISKDPEMRAIGGSSSGGICAFTAAWEHPEVFRKVYINVGSFTNLRGGDAYQALVRKTEPKPLRIYMADTSGDIDNQFGSWPWANQLMASSLKYMGYDVRFDWAEGYAHNDDFGSQTFPEAMKWLWRTEKHQPTLDTKGDLKGDLTILKLLIPGEDWEVVADNLGFADAPCTDSEGNFYFSDMRAPAVFKINRQGEKSVIVKEAVSGLEFGPNGWLYGCQGAQNRVISIDPASGEVKVVATNVSPNDLAITRDGWIYITETQARRITRISIATGEITPVDTGTVELPNGIGLSNDQGTLAVSEYGGQYVWMARVNADGTLDAQMPIMSLRLPIQQSGDFKFNAPPPYMTAAQGDGLAIDKIGRYYVTSALGVQIFDPTGRLCGVLPKPKANQPLTSCILAGENHQYLYITNGDTIYRRKLTIE